MKGLSFPGQQQLQQLRDMTRKQVQPVMIERMQRGAGLTKEQAELATHIALGVLGFNAK